MTKLLAILGLCVGAFAVCLQIVLTVTSRMEAGDSFFSALVYFFSFFTILINIPAVLVYIAYLFPGRLPAFATPLMRGTIGVAIAIVGLVYATVLAGTWAPKGLFWVCDVLLHYVAPVVYVSWWFSGGRNGRLKWRDITKILAFPLVYCVYAVTRGLTTGQYAYPFLNVDVLGGTQVFINAIIVAAFFLAFSIAAIWYDRRFAAVPK